MVTLSDQQLRITVATPSVPVTCNTKTCGDISSSEGVSNKTIGLAQMNEAATIAELRWALRSVSCKYSVASVDGIAETLDAMSPGSVPEGFSLGRAKMGYLITDALGPYFKDKLVDDVGTSFYTVKYDETTNAKDAKELQVTIQFWSRTRKQIESHHLETFF